MLYDMINLVLVNIIVSITIIHPRFMKWYRCILIIFEMEAGKRQMHDYLGFFEESSSINHFCHCCITRRLITLLNYPCAISLLWTLVFFLTFDVIKVQIDTGLFCLSIQDFPFFVLSCLRVKFEFYGISVQKPWHNCQKKDQFW